MNAPLRRLFWDDIPGCVAVTSRVGDSLDHVFPLPEQLGEKLAPIAREQPIENGMDKRWTDPCNGALSGLPQ